MNRVVGVTQVELSDFRAAATACSLRRSHGPPAWELREQRSGIWPAGGDGRSIQRRISALLLTGLVTGFSLLAAGPVILKWLGGPDERTTPAWVLALGITCSLGGITTLLGSAILGRRLVRRAILKRETNWPLRQGLSGGIPVELENADTFSKFKPVPEDAGILLLDPGNRRARIVGLRFIYHIDCADVLSFDTVRGNTSSAGAVRFAVDDVVVHLAITNNSLLDELRRQTIGLKRPTLAKALEKCLKPDVGTRSGPL
jgi:hypothetical protein